MEARSARTRLHACFKCGTRLSAVKGPMVFAVRGAVDRGRDGMSAAPVRFFCSSECRDGWQVERALAGGEPGTAVDVEALEYVGPRG